MSEKIESLARKILESGYEYSGGGKIHIKPENRGKFTALKERTGHSATWFKEHGTPSQKKMAVFELNSRHWNHKHADGGLLLDADGINLFDGGGWSGGFVENYRKLPSTHKAAVLKVSRRLGIPDRDIARWYSSEDGRRILAGYYNGFPNDGRVRENDSPTKEESESRTRAMHSAIMQGTSDGIPTVPYTPSGYDVPYLLEKEKVVPSIGRVSMNAVDSLAKYAGQAGISMQEALGLFSQETKGGAMPFGNYKSYKSTKGLTGKALEDAKRYNAEVDTYNRSLGNSNYFREYGLIPANYLVRDYEYDRVGHEVDRSVPPLLHAFEYFKAGKYNRGDKSHTGDVLNAGKKALDTKVIRDYLADSPYMNGVRMYKNDKR